MLFAASGDDTFTDTTLPTPSVTMTPFPFVLMASVAGGLSLLIVLLIVCFSVRSCLGYTCCHSRKKTNGISYFNISDLWHEIELNGALIMKISEAIRD